MVYTNNGKEHGLKGRLATLLGQAAKPRRVPAKAFIRKAASARHTPGPTATEQTLLKLLGARNPRDYTAADDDAVRALLERDPAAARSCEARGAPVLLRALSCRASPETIRLLVDACPEAARGDCPTSWSTALHCACHHGAALDVVRLIYEQRPEAIAIRDGAGNTPLHKACSGRDVSSLGVIQFLVDKRRDSLAGKDQFGRTPLALACKYRRTYDDLLLFLIENYPDAVKEKDSNGFLPLHSICHGGASLEAVALLADSYPEALGSKTDDDDTPLHLACVIEAPLGVVKLLIERCPKALEMHNKARKARCTPLQYAKLYRNASPEVIDLLTTIESLKDLKDNEHEIIDILHRFHAMSWQGGVALVLDACPNVMNKMDDTLMPTVLSLVGRNRKLTAFYSMLRDNPALVKGAVKRKQAEELPVEQAQR